MFNDFSIEISLENNLIASLIGWMNPLKLTLSGPLRICERPIIFRSINEKNVIIMINEIVGQIISVIIIISELIKNSKFLECIRVLV